MRYSDEDECAIIGDGKFLRCSTCDGEKFGYQEAQLNTALASFFGFDWVNETAACLTCRDCGQIFWFKL